MRMSGTRRLWWAAWLAACGGLAGLAGLAPAQLVLNEVYYDSPEKTSAEEFVELHNPGGTAVSIGGWRLTDGLAYTFPANTVVPAGGYLVVAQDPPTLLRRFGVTASGPWTGRVSNTGETLTLQDAAGHTIDQVAYQRGFPWPTCPDGSSMELLNASLDNDLGGSWRSSSNPDAQQGVLLPSQSSFWHFFKGKREPSSPVDAWRGTNFTEDADWLVGQTPVGSGSDSDNTEIPDMFASPFYTTVYFRHPLYLPAEAALPAQLLVRVCVNDGAILWLNGREVKRWRVNAGQIPYNGTANATHTAAWEEYVLTNAASFLAAGHTNWVAVHALNRNTRDGSFSFDIELRLPPAGGSLLPSPGARNRVYDSGAPPQVRQVAHSPPQPAAGVPVTITAKATDPDGVRTLSVAYQDVAPGSYVRLTDTAYANGWTTLPMRDDGTNGDAVAGDSVFTAVVPGDVQKHRHLVRYRLTAEDRTGRRVTVPYTDDPQPNFAYLVYSGVPAWTAANQPGVTAPVTFPTNLLAGALPVYHLLAQEADVINCQYNSAYQQTRFYGTLVYAGKVYDHIQFKVRGEYSTYQCGKNKWRFYFTTGHDFQPLDNFGNPYPATVHRMNFNGCSSPWITANRGMAGLDEGVSGKLYALAGVLAPRTHFVHLRVVDNVNETAPTSQYEGDLWGLYASVEYIDNRFLDGYGQPDGNVYKILGETTEQRNQGPTQPADGSDWTAFRASAGNDATPTAWWRANFDLASYYAFHAVNRIVGNVDLRDTANFALYHHPDGPWYTIPQDLDMMFIPETHWSGVALMKACLQRPELAIEFRNRARELLDLLCAEAGPYDGQVGQVVRELGLRVNTIGQALTFADVDQFQWNYHPRTTGGHAGAFYANPKAQGMIGGTYTRTLATADYEGFAAYVRDYATDTDPDAWAAGDGDQRGYGYNFLESEAADANIPNRPTLAYAGPTNYPLDALRFTCGPFGDPDGGTTFGAMRWRLAEIYNEAVAGYVAGEPWKYEVTPHWESAAVTRFTNAVAVPPNGLRAGGRYRVRVRHQDNTGRWSHWSAPVDFTAAAPIGTAALLPLVPGELHYNPTPFQETEFVELLNTGATALNIGGVALDGAVNFTFPPDTFVPAGGYVLAVKDVAAFDNRYRNPASPYYRAGLVVAGAWAGSLANEGETLTLRAPGGAELWRVPYSAAGDWPTRADGRGSSLELVTPAAVPAAQPARNAWLADGRNWRSSALLHGSPGWDGASADTLVLGEVLAHSDAAPGLDWVELANTGTTHTALADYYLSDSFATPLQVALGPLAAGVPAGGWTVLDENQLGLAFSELGEQLVLSRLVSNRVVFVDSADFGASVRDATFGRHTRSDGETDFTWLSQATAGNLNAYPRVGPVVISELHYHPAAGAGAEFVELANLADEPVPLYLAEAPTNTWRLTGAVDYVFPTNVVLAGHGVLLITATDPAAFRAQHGLPPDVPVYGPWEGALDNAGDTVRLRMPYAPEPTGFVPYVLVDRVSYRPVAPWPAEADGAGPALERVTLYAYGNDPAHWRASAVTGGTPGVVDGPWLHMLIAGMATASEGETLRWQAIPGERYDVEYSERLTPADWQHLQTITADATVMALHDTPSAAATRRYYRITWRP